MYVVFIFTILYAEERKNWSMPRFIFLSFFYKSILSDMKKKVMVLTFSLSIFQHVVVTGNSTWYFRLCQILRKNAKN